MIQTCALVPRGDIRESKRHRPRRPSILHAASPRPRARAGIDQPVDREHLLCGLTVTLSRDRGLRRQRHLSPLGEPTPLRHACAPTLEHAARIPSIRTPCRPVRSQLPDQAGKTDLAQVVPQAARVKMSLFAIPADDGVTQRRELVFNLLQSGALLLDFRT
jgi:hypothetical protein